MDAYHWRDTARQSKFFMMDSSAFFPILFTIVDFALWKLYAAIAIGFVLGILARYGFTPKVAFYFIRAKIAEFMNGGMGRFTERPFDIIKRNL